MEMEKVVEQAKSWVLRYGCHPTVLLVHGAKGNRYIYLPGFPNEYAEKIGCMFGAGKRTAELGNIGKIYKLFLVIEAWQRTNITIRPSQDPKRIEVLVIGCLDVLTKEQKETTLEYVRDEKGNLIEIKDIVLPNGKTVARAEGPLFPAFVAGYNLR